MPPSVPQQQPASLLLALPEQLLLEVLQRCNRPSRLVAAEAHSRLRQAVRQLVLVGDSLSVQEIRQQDSLDSALLYLRHHRQHISSLSLGGKGSWGKPTLQLPRLPSKPKLNSLQLRRLELQWSPGPERVLGCKGVSALKQLRLSQCRLLDGDRGLAAALAQLPGLEHLSLSYLWQGSGSDNLRLRLSSLQGLQQLTFLQLGGLTVLRSDRSSPPLQPLQALTRLADLRLAVTAAVTAGVLSGATGLTRLEVSFSTRLDSGILLGLTQLQHLDIEARKMPAVLMWQLEPLQQLTHLNWHFRSYDASDVPSAAAFSALTASSRLQHLCLQQWYFELPDGIWQHLLPAGRQLPSLTSLTISCDNRFQQTPPEGSRLVSCCPNLRSLDVSNLCCTAELLAQLRGLGGLQTVMLGFATVLDDEVFRAVYQLSGLRKLSLPCRLQLQATQLKQLTALSVQNAILSDRDGQPVWRQVLQHLCVYGDPEVAQQAAAALVDSDGDG